MGIPQEFQALFPSAPISALDSERDKIFIIEQLLSRASLDAWRWMLSTYSKNDIIGVIRISPRLSIRDINVWSCYFSIPIKDMQCTIDDFQLKRKSFWNY